MPRNIGSIDLVVRSILGIALIAYVGKEGALMSAWGLVALAGALLATGILSYCPLYHLLDVSTVERIDHSI